MNQKKYCPRRQKRFHTDMKSKPDRNPKMNTVEQYLVIVPSCWNQNILQQCSLSLTQRPSFWGHTWSSYCGRTQEQWYTFRNKRPLQGELDTMFM